MNQKNRPLKFTDHLFLHLDKKNQPMQVIGICVFELPTGVADDVFFKPLIDSVTSGAVLPQYPFDQKLKNKLFWQFDDDFNHKNHFFVHRLSDNANDLNDLASLTASINENRLNRNAPLWEYHLVKNLAPTDIDKPNRFAILVKMHHCVTDGIGLVRLLHKGLSDKPSDNFGLPFWRANNPNQATQHTKKPHEQPPQKLHPIALAKSAINNTILASSALKQRFGEQPTGFTATTQAPKSVLNQAIDGRRQVIFKTLSKSRLDTIAKQLGTSGNTVLMAVCASALRVFLGKQNALPSEPLIGFVPISLRKDNSNVGNQMSFLLANLGTDKDNPAERLAMINDSITDAKGRFDDLTAPQIIVYSAMIYGLAMGNLLTGIAPTRQSFNLLISNVPNKDERVYLNGAKLTDIYPTSVLFDGQAMNITNITLGDNLNIGITVCPSVVQGVDGFGELLEQGVIELENLIAQ